MGGGFKEGSRWCSQSSLLSPAPTQGEKKVSSDSGSAPLLEATASGAAGPRLGRATAEAKSRVKAGEESGFFWLLARLSIKSIFLTAEFTYSETSPSSGRLTLPQYCFQMGRYPLGARPRRHTGQRAAHHPAFVLRVPRGRLSGVEQGCQARAPMGITAGSRQSGYQRTPGPEPWAERPLSCPHPVVRAVTGVGRPGLTGAPVEGILFVCPAPGKSHRTIPAFCRWPGWAHPSWCSLSTSGQPLGPRGPCPPPRPWGLPALRGSSARSECPGGIRVAVVPSVRTKLCSPSSSSLGPWVQAQGRAGSVHGGACGRSGWQAGR